MTWIYVVWGLLLLIGAVGVTLRHLFFERRATRKAETVRMTKQSSYEAMVVELDEVEKLPDPIARAQGIAAAQAHYFERITPPSGFPSQPTPSGLPSQPSTSPVLPPAVQ